MDSWYTTFFFCTGHLPQQGLSFSPRGPELEIEMVSYRLFKVTLKGFGAEMFTLVFFQQLLSGERARILPSFFILKLFLPLICIVSASLFFWNLFGLIKIMILK